MSPSMEVVGYMPEAPTQNNLGGCFYGSEDLRAMGFDCGENVLIHDTCQIVNIRGVKIGKNVRIDPFCVLSASGGYLHMGDYIHIASRCSVFAGGGVELHDFSGLSGGVTIYSTSDDYSGAVLTNPTVPEEYLRVTKKAVVIGRHGLIGAGAILLPGAMVGEGSAVGSLSLVTKPLEPWGIYFGQPAKRLKGRKRDLLDAEARLRGIGVAA